MIQQSRTAEQFPLRLPRDLRTRIKSSATENGRSMNSEIIFHLVRLFPETKSETQKADARA